MITFFGTGPMFGLPHASPFAIKGEVLLKMAGVDYVNKKANLMKAPKGKMPWIDDDGTLVPDTAFIKKHLEDKYGADFSGGYDARALAYGLAIERMLEDHGYWLNTCVRWLNDENFNKGPIQFFNDAPALLRPFIIKMVRSKVRKGAYAHGISRHNDAERAYLAQLMIDALAAMLGDNDFILGDRPSGADATVYGQLASIETPYFNSPIGDMVRAHPNLMAYLARMHDTYFSDM